MKPITHDPSPWWHFRFMWLVIGGPLAVVVAALVTAAIAVQGADPAAQVTEADAAARSAAPAVQARNHAATPSTAAERKP